MSLAMWIDASDSVCVCMSDYLCVFEVLLHMH